MHIMHQPVEFAQVVYAKVGGGEGSRLGITYHMNRRVRGGARWVLSSSLWERLGINMGPEPVVSNRTIN
jgi:hypothetical protein